MNDTFSAIQAAMLNDAERLTFISQNLANANTAGYKKQVPVNNTFVDVLTLQELQTSEGSVYQHVKTSLPHIESFADTSAGTYKFTGNALDVVANGNTYFSVLTPSGVAYTKQGSFSQDQSGMLVNTLGYPVLGESGEIIMNTSNPVIDNEGNVYEGEKLLNKLKMVSFAPDTELNSIGFGMYTVTNTPEFATDAKPSVRQGYLEMSNVVIMDEMVKLIETMRHFEAGQHFMRGLDDMLDSAINVIGDV